PLLVFPLGQTIFFAGYAGHLPARIGRLFGPHELDHVARLQHLRKLVEQLVVGLNVFGAPHRRPPQQGVHFVPIGSDVLSLSRVRWPAALAIGTNSSLPVTHTSIHRDAQYFRQLAIGFKVLHGTVDRARFFVVLDPSLEYGSDGHRRLGADIPGILAPAGALEKWNK